jgi:hypothetical protein
MSPSATRARPPAASSSAQRSEGLEVKRFGGVAHRAPHSAFPDAAPAAIRDPYPVRLGAITDALHDERERSRLCAVRAARLRPGKRYGGAAHRAPHSAFPDAAPAAIRDPYPVRLCAATDALHDERERSRLRAVLAARLRPGKRYGGTAHRTPHSAFPDAAPAAIRDPYPVRLGDGAVALHNDGSRSRRCAVRAARLRPGKRYGGAARRAPHSAFPDAAPAAIRDLHPVRLGDGAVALHDDGSRSRLCAVLPHGFGRDA